MSSSEQRGHGPRTATAIAAALAIGALAVGALVGGSVPASATETVLLPDIVVEAPPTAAKTFERFDTARKTLLPTIGATSYTLTREAIETLPQGDNTPFDRLLLQAPGVVADSAASHPDFHIRNEYANAQYRINGILLPDGVTELGPILDTSFVGTLSLLTGTLPAQYGLRTAGVVDITSRIRTVPGGSVSLYGGSHGTITPSLDYGGTSGDTQYFVALRGFRSTVGIENPTPNVAAIHDRTEQGKGFGTISKLLSDSARLTVMAGVSVSQFQIPNNPNQMPLGDFGGTRFSSSSLNERETDRSTFGIIALQTNSAKLDTQLSLVTRVAQVHFVPDIAGDLAFNNAASDVSRKSLLNGLQGDAAYRLDDRQTLRAGFGLTVEQTANDNILTALPLDPTGAPLPNPVTFTDSERKLGINAGGYVQDEIKLAPLWTLNVGLRFDQLYQYVTTNQVSPRLALLYRPDDATTVHIGYARYFTPPNQSEGATPDIALARGTTLQPEVGIADPVRPERSHYVDVGADRRLLPGLDVGVDAYLKLATDLIDDGQFGQAQVLSQLNYARATSEGLEFKAKYTHGGFTAYGNLATNRTKDTRPSSNQYVLDADEYAYIATHAIFADDVQLVTASAGLSYRTGPTVLSAAMIYGSGLRSDFANLGHVPAYTQVNLGISQVLASCDGKPLTARFDIVNAFDTIYQIRDGSGIGVFAPQYGPRRGFYVGLTKVL
jgi:outer membrane cobalamin receptor